MKLRRYARFFEVFEVSEAPEIPETLHGRAMKKKPETAVLVLAGGASRRMGRDKASLLLGGEALLARTVRAATEATPGAIAVVTPWPERYARLVPPASCHWVREDRTQTAGAGPLRGILQGLAYIRQHLQQQEWVLVLACDLPYLSGVELTAWTQQLENVPPATMALLPRGQKGWEPLCGFYRQNCAASLATYWDEGGRSLQGWLQQQTAIAILQIEDRRTLFNCNTPEDWARVVRDFGGSSIVIDPAIDPKDSVTYGTMQP